MAKNVSAVESHPQRQRIIDALIAGQPLREIAAWTNPPIHFTSLARYSRNRVAPALRKQGEIAKVLKQNEILKQQVQEAGNTTEIAAATKASLAAEPILDRVNWIWSELREGVAESKSAWIEDPVSGERKHVAGDLKARASLLNVARGITETEARVLQLPGFVPQAQTGTTNNTMVVVMPNLRDVQQRVNEAEVIDIDVVADRR